MADLTCNLWEEALTELTDWTDSHPEPAPYSARGQSVLLHAHVADITEEMLDRHALVGGEVHVAEGTIGRNITTGRCGIRSHCIRWASLCHIKADGRCRPHDEEDRCVVAAPSIRLEKLPHGVDGYADGGNGKDEIGISENCWSHDFEALDAFPPSLRQGGEGDIYVRQARQATVSLAPRAFSDLEGWKDGLRAAFSTCVHVHICAPSWEAEQILKHLVCDTDREVLR